MQLEYIIATMESIPDLAFDEAVKELRGEEFYHENISEEDYGASVSMKGNRNRTIAKTYEKKTCECYRYGKKGHIKKGC
jgi:hypothetical protein